MTVKEFIESGEAARFIERAARAAAMPVSVRYAGGLGGEVAVSGSGSCAVCRYAAAMDAGRRACEVSRRQPVQDALRRGRPIVFLCHLGMANLVIPVFTRLEAGWVAVAGPYCPAEAPQSLRDDVLDGLRRVVGHMPDGLPVSLDDVSLLPSTMPSAWAAWFAEGLDVLYERCGAGDHPDVSGGDEPDAGSPRRPRRKLRVARDAEAADMAAALAAGDQAHARELVQAALHAPTNAGGVRTAALHARTVAIVAEALEAAADAGLDAAGCWERFEAFVGEVRAARTEVQLGQAAMAILGILKRRATRGDGAVTGLQEIQAIVSARLTEGVELDEVARQLGVHPTTITHRLQRKFGLSYSEYVGRLRIDKAKGILRRTKLSVGEVARRVGIDDASNFARLFRRHEGLSPVQYREKFRRK